MIRVGDTGVDFSYAKPPAARLIDLGHSFIVGYISVPPASPGKNLTVAQYDSYAALERFLVWEMTDIRASLGAAYGAQDGRDAARMAAERHYPLDKPILAADDTNTVGSNIDAQEAYMRAFAEWCKPWLMGIYGDVDILERCQGLWVLGWVPNAWAWSGLSRADAEAKARAVGAHVLQHKGFYIDNIWAVDPNVVIRDFASTPHPPVTDSEDDMSEKWVLRAGTADEVWEICHNDGRTWGFHVGGPHDPGARNEVLSGLFYDPANLKPVDGAILDGLPTGPRTTGVDIDLSQFAQAGHGHKVTGEAT